jgi:hypothetical protein
MTLKSIARVKSKDIKNYLNFSLAAFNAVICLVIFLNEICE